MDYKILVGMLPSGFYIMGKEDQLSIKDGEKTLSGFTKWYEMQGPNGEIGLQPMPDPFLMNDTTYVNTRQFVSWKYLDEKNDAHMIKSYESFLQKYRLAKSGIVSPHGPAAKLIMDNMNSKGNSK